MSQKYVSGQLTVFGPVRSPRLPWRDRQRERRSRERWQEAVRVARTPIVHTATDENCPTHVVVSHGYGVAHAFEASDETCNRTDGENHA
jgi:hypothetical protein